MKECCVKYFGGAISSVYYCSGDLWNAELNFGKPKGYKIISFCPECGDSMENIVKHYPELAEARGVKPAEVKFLGGDI